MIKALIINILFIISACPFYGRTLKIVKLNTESIIIGVNNRKCMVDSTFEETEEIKWRVPKQDMWAKVVSDTSRELMHFTREAFASKKAKTPAEYFQKINHPSVRAAYDMPFLVGKNKSLFPEKRIALVIGNSNYFYLSSLSNPINDAVDITEKLQSLGFDVFSLYDVNYSDFDTALKKISGTAQDYDAAIIYYCGHGIQYKGLHYLVPVDTRLSDEDDLLKCIDIEDVFSKLNRTPCATKLVFLDACRNEASWRGKQEAFKDQNASDIGVVYSTGPNQFSYDGNINRNSPFAEAFLQNIGNPSPNILSTINAISISLDSICIRMELPKQRLHVSGSWSTEFTFVDYSAHSSKDLVINDIQQLIEMAESNDARAYVPLAKYYLKNAAGITSYEKVHIYALKAIQAGVNVSEANELIDKLKKLGFYEVSNPQIRN